VEFDIYSALADVAETALQHELSIWAYMAAEYVTYYAI